MKTKTITWVNGVKLPPQTNVQEYLDKNGLVAVSGTTTRHSKTIFHQNIKAVSK